jgi:hypothetical protein
MMYAMTNQTAARLGEARKGTLRRLMGTDRPEARSQRRMPLRRAPARRPVALPVAVR